MVEPPGGRRLHIVHASSMCQMLIAAHWGLNHVCVHVSECVHTYVKIEAVGVDGTRYGLVNSQEKLRK